MNFQRSSGILLHPTSLPGPHGIGDFGPESYRWVDFLFQAGIGLWQILPLGPTGYGDSPYQSFSAFAGNIYLINPELLVKDGLLQNKDISTPPLFPKNKVNFPKVKQWKNSLFQFSFDNFRHSKNKKLKDEFAAFIKRHRFWLDDYTMYMAIKSANGEQAWNRWPDPLRFREPTVLCKFAQENRELRQFHEFLQFLFFRQWHKLKEYAYKKQVRIIGDIPIFVAYDSADIWSSPEHYDLNEQLEPRVVAGVPPDYFSPSGQLWGNPHFRWDVHKRDNYQWWIKRIRHSLSLVDILRLDHFRGFAGYWEVPAGKPTAERGRWVEGPGMDFFNGVNKILGDVPLIAEDLGVISPDVKEMREKFGFPGMKIFQFAFSTDTTDPFLPHNYPVNCVAYTGTHDNETARGWFEHAPEKERQFYLNYLHSNGQHIAWDFIRAVWSSVAAFAIAPMQDFLELGNSARMNFPGRPTGNWNWRMAQDALIQGLANKIKEINILYRRDQSRKEKEKSLPQLKYHKR